MAIKWIEIRISIKRENRFYGTDPPTLRKIELLLARHGVQNKLQIGRRCEFVLSQLSGDLEGGSLSSSENAAGPRSRRLRPHINSRYWLVESPEPRTDVPPQ